MIIRCMSLYLWLEERDRWQRILVRLDHIPSGQDEVALYVHAHDAWDVLITERRASTGCSCTLVSLLTP